MNLWVGSPLHPFTLLLTPVLTFISGSLPSGFWLGFHTERLEGGMRVRTGFRVSVLIWAHSYRFSREGCIF